MKLLAPIIFLLLAVAGSALAPMAAAEIAIHKAQGAKYVSGGVTPEEVCVPRSCRGCTVQAIMLQNPRPVRRRA